MAPTELLRTADESPPRSGASMGPSAIADEDPGAIEEPSLREAARSLYSRRHDPGLQVDIRIATSIGGVLWLGGSMLALAMLALAPPDRALGTAGWLVAAVVVGAGLAIGAARIRGGTRSDFGLLFWASLVALVGIAVLEWLAGGRSAPYHDLYALPVLYAASIQTRARALLVLVLVVVVAWAPVLYAPPSRELPADIAGQLLLLLVLGVAARISFTLLRAQRAGLRRAHEQAHRFARRDALTGLGNRLHLEETLEVEVARARRQRTPLSLIIGDLDGFKAVNDALGHSGGDECLRRVAAAIAEASRTEDQCFRWGGDEFVVVLPNTGASEAVEVRRRVCSAASGAWTSDGRSVRLTCGTAELGPYDTVRSLLSAADEVLFRFKGSAERTHPSEAAARSGRDPE
jgi:diguanylate cyclase (GGDEF)-like protein